MAFGQLGILPTDFYRMTFAETILTLQGYNVKQCREWERVRLVAYQVYISIPKKTPNKTITNYLPLFTDNEFKKNYSAQQIRDRRQAFIDKLSKN